ncbi:MAG: CopD family copper resistance protein [Microvirgula sp.]
MSYPVLLILHLFAALIFIGTVFFEVLILEGVRRQMPAASMRELEQAISARARTLMPWVLLVLFSAGLGLGWHHRAALMTPLAGGFGTLLTLKITLALSVLGHFLIAMRWRGCGQMSSVRFRRLHLSVFCHMVAIVLLAKSMFYLHG